VGVPLRLLPLPDGLLLVHLVDGAPRFTHLAPGSGDLDSDGTADSADAFPLDPAESSDRDGDGVGDHEDAFPDDPFEFSDRDGDRIGDESDWLPDLPAAAMAKLVVDMRFAIRPLGRLGARSGNQLHLFADGSFALCSGPASCLAGFFAPDPRHPQRLMLSMHPASLEDLAADLAAAVEPAFEDRYGPLSLSLAFLPDRARLSVESKRSGKIVLSIKLPHEALIPERRPKPYPGVFRIRGTGELVEPG
jgi:hypothetical protein